MIANSWPIYYLQHFSLILIKIIPCLNQGWQSHRRGSSIFVTTIKLRCDVILHLTCRCNFCCNYLNFFDAIFCVGICDYLCDLRLFRFFEQFWTFVFYKSSRQCKNWIGLSHFLVKLSFYAPSCSAGSTLTPNTFFGKIYQRFRELCSSF